MGRGPVSSYCGPLPEGGAVLAIATDAVNCLSSLYSPGHNTAHLVPVKDVENAFVQAFENGLRTKGFTVVPDAGADIVIVAYTLDALFEKNEKSAWHLQLRISNNEGSAISIARAYMETDQSEAGQSRTEIEFKRSMLRKAVDKTKKQRAKPTTLSAVSSLNRGWLCRMLALIVWSQQKRLMPPV